MFEEHPVRSGDDEMFEEDHPTYVWTWEEAWASIGMSPPDVNA